MSEFSDRRFIAGSLFGLRTFQVDSLARLTGVNFKSVWTPGENVATCRKSELSQWGTISATSMFGSLVPPGFTYDPATGMVTRTTTLPALTPRPEKPGADEDLVSLKCTCGFYAYFDGGNDYEEAQYVSGVVEGFGRVVMGSRGFRAEKARIVALIRPKHLRRKSRGDIKVDELWERVQHNYDDIPAFDSARKATASHPLTPPPPPSPETDDDFWTRSAS